MREIFIETLKKDARKKVWEDRLTADGEHIVDDYASGNISNMSIIGNTYELKYKDANRVWWKIELICDRVDGTHTLEGDDNFDHIWSYKLIREDDNCTVSTGEVWEQYDLIPTTESIMGSVLHNFNFLAMGIAKYGKFDKTKEIYE